MKTSKIEKSSKKIPWLAGLFGVQVVLAVMLFNMHNRQPAGQNEHLLAFDRAALDYIEITAPDGQIKLEKKDGQWQLGEGLPALASRVDELLKEFEGIRGGWAVATTPEAAARFEVTEAKFRRKIHFRQGSAEVGSLLLGTSPNFRSSHVRKPGEKEIYSVKLDEFSLPVEQESWLDNQLLRPKGDVTALQFGEKRIEKISGQWPAPTPDAVASVQPVESADTAAPTGFDSAAFSKALAELTVQGVAKDQAELDAPTTDNAQIQAAKSQATTNNGALLQIRWQVITSDGVYDYQLLSKNDQYYIRRGDVPHTFKLSKTQYDALVKIQELRQS